MILHCIPYSVEKNLGKEYNRIIDMIGPNDAACFQDGDVCQLVPEFGTIIDEYHNLFPEAVLTCRTNRIHILSKQLRHGMMDEKCDIRDLIKIAESVKHLRTVTEIHPGEAMSGFLMVVPKSVGIKFIDGCLGVDSQFRVDLHNAGKKIYIMDGLFVWHTYRLLNGTGYKDHLK